MPYTAHHLTLFHCLLPPSNNNQYWFHCLGYYPSLEIYSLISHRVQTGGLRHKPFFLRLLGIIISPHWRVAVLMPYQKIIISSSWRRLGYDRGAYMGTRTQKSPLLAASPRARSPSTYFHNLLRFRFHPPKAKHRHRHQAPRASRPRGTTGLPTPAPN